MASSAHNQHQQRQLNLPNIYVGANSAPPPTPSNNDLATSGSAAAADADALSRLLHRLPSPTLSLPNNTRTRRSSSATRPPPLISLSNPNDQLFLSAASQLGFFQLTNHNISSQLAHSSELEALSLFELEREKKEKYFPKNWPLGYEADEDEDDGGGGGNGASFCLDSSCSTESTELNLTSLREFTRAMEEAGLMIIEMLSSALGFENPLGDDPTRICSLLWMSKNLVGNNPVLSGGYYPYIVGLQYQIRPRKHMLLADSGSVSVSAQVDSILVTLGDIAQVWSNGKTKKVRSGRPIMAGLLGDEKNSSAAVEKLSMILLVTLPMDSIVSPLSIITPSNNNNNNNKKLEQTVTNGNGDDEMNNAEKIEARSHDDGDGDDGDDDDGEVKERKLFESFSFEDYAWRVYHERLLFKYDPLDRYRI